MTCPTCGAAFIRHGGECTTLVGFSYGSCGGSHDDNCLKRIYICEQGHHTLLSIVRLCNDHNGAPLCEWTGKADCFCHVGAKVLAWPENVRGPVDRSEIIF